MITRKKVLETLKKVNDPELHINIVDLGLVYKVTVGKKIHILMTLTSPGCPLAGMFEALVKHALKQLPRLDVDRDVQIELTFDPPWTADMMSEAAKAELGF